MTDKVHASYAREYRSREVAVARRHGGGDWVQPSTSRLVADTEGDLATGALNAFDESHGAASLDVTIDTGEAVVAGMYLARDATTTVTLAASTNGQVVYLGWADGQTDTVIIGLSGDFGAEDRKTAIWEFDTDGSGVTGTPTDRRGPLGPHVEATGELSGPTASEGDTVFVESSPDAIPVYFDSTTGQVLVPDLEDPQ